MLNKKKERIKNTCSITMLSVFFILSSLIFSEAPFRDALSGPAGSRTPVRTRKPYAFYTLIPAFIFVRQQDLDHQLPSYPLKLFIKNVGPPLTISEEVCTAESLDSENDPRSDVSSPRLAQGLSQ